MMYASYLLAFTSIFTTILTTEASNVYRHDGFVTNIYPNDSNIPDVHDGHATSIWHHNNESHIQDVYHDRQVRAEPPEAFDWRERNGVSPVKHQGQCNDGYAFATIAAVESIQLIKKNQQVDLSEQQIVSCAVSDGCQGGSAEAALGFATNVGVTSSANYPYESGSGNVPACQEGKEVVARIWGFKSLSQGNEDNMKRILYNVGPLVATIEAAGFDNYQGGIIDQPKNPNGYQQPHDVLIVGYGADNGIPYWSVKNSWGPGWGELGFARIERGVNALGIAQHAIAVYHID